MITLKDLREYRILCSELDSLRKRIEKGKRHVYDTVQSAAEPPFSLHSVKVEGDLYDPNVKPLLAQYVAKRARKAEIERFVAGIDDYRVRRAVEIRFIEPAAERVTWEYVADMMGDGSSGNALKLMVWKFFQKS